jgi:Family of unknown function (DUF6185)
VRGLTVITCGVGLAALAGALIFSPDPAGAVPSGPVPLSQAQLQAGCDLGKLGSPAGTASLLLRVPHIDEASWSSTVTLAVPLSWPLAGNLLQADPDSPGFLQAYSCLFPSSAFPPGTATATVVGQTVRLVVTAGQAITLWDVGLEPPWQNGPTPVRGSIPVTFGDAGPPDIDWTSVTVQASGFTITAPAPLPTSETGDDDAYWDASAGRRSTVTLGLQPSRFLGDALTDQQALGGQYAPYELEVAAFTLGLAGLLWRRRGRQHARRPDRVWLTVFRLCLLNAGLAIASATGALVSQSGWTQRGLPGASFNASLAVVIFGLPSLAAAVTFWPRLRAGGRCLLAIGAIAWILVSAGPVIVGSGSSLSAIFNNDRYSVGLQLAMMAGGMVLGWLLVFDSIAALGRREVSRRQGRVCVLLAGLVTLIVITLAVRGRGILPDDVYIAAGLPTAQRVVITLLTSFLIGFGVIRIVAQDMARSSTAARTLLLTDDDRGLIAVGFGLTVLVTQPQFYLGVQFGAIALLVTAATWGVLLLSRNRSVVALVADELSRREPGALPALQLRLGRASARLADVNAELKAMSKPLTAEQRQRREYLERERAELHRWPATEREPEPAPGLADFVLGVLRRMLGEGTSAAVAGPALPDGVGPGDVALALGPSCGPLANVGRALPWAAGLVAIPVAYFGWREASVGGSVSATLFSPQIPLVTSLAQELAFWLFPLLMLALTWSSLAGRRGPVRGSQVWLCLGIPLALGALFNHALDQSGVYLTLTRALLLLLGLVLLGLWFDLVTIKRYSSDTSVIDRFQGYVRLNRVVATVTLLIPLVTAGLTLWSQADSGGLTQKLPPSQSQTQPTSGQTARPGAPR